jgi:hypothetical protein
VACQAICLGLQLYYSCSHHVKGVCTLIPVALVRLYFSLYLLRKLACKNDCVYYGVWGDQGVFTLAFSILLRLFFRSLEFEYVLAGFPFVGILLFVLNPSGLKCLPFA